MYTLEENMINFFGERGSDWIVRLPNIIADLAELWNLTEIVPVDNMNWNYVAYAVQHGSRHVVIKINCAEHLIMDEVRTLEFFAGRGVINIIAYNKKNHALLIDRAQPGDTLISCYPHKIQQVMRYYGHVINQIRSIKQTDLDHQEFEHVGDWVEDIEKVDRAKEPAALYLRLIDSAIKLKNWLLKSNHSVEIILHGDLHLSNILSNINHKSNQASTQWISIDPKGVVGEIYFEAACFDFITEPEYKFENSSHLPEILRERIYLLADTLGLSYERLYFWVFIRIIFLAVRWIDVDNHTAKLYFKRAEALFPEYAQ